MSDYQKKYYSSVKGKEKKKLYNKTYNNNLRLEILKHYSGGTEKCACCGIREIEFLTIDHIKGGGAKHRKEVGQGTTFYNWIKRNNFPKGFRILCMNCNHSLGHYGYCVHNTFFK